MSQIKRRSAGLLLGLTLFGCTGNTSDRGLPTSSPSSTPSTAAPAASPSSPAAAPHPVSIQALIQKQYDGRNLKLGRVLATTSSYTRYFVSYRSGNLRISGILNLPKGAGPFPALVLAHGHIDTDIYVNGQGMRREQDYLAREGYIVLHTDYRNHAASDDDPNAELGLRLGYTEDVLNAIMALKSSTLPIDKENIGVVGRSMGGGVAYNAAVVRPDLVDAVVVFAPVSSDVVDNFNRWIRREGERRELAEQISKKYGSPEGNPEFWRNVSPRSFFDRVEVPLVIHHGTSDDSCPIAWSEETVAAMKAAGVDVRYFVYQGEEHAFGPLWPRSMRRTVAYLDALLKV
ncbi:MAG TPA: alpha/beta fold hydrolase [Actinomycetota bacterium]|nr:alpha/beta fold hydrolase [Actinomycetota bacterium]